MFLTLHLYSSESKAVGIVLAVSYEGNAHKGAVSVAHPQGTIAHPAAQSSWDLFQLFLIEWTWAEGCNAVRGQSSEDCVNVIRGSLLWLRAKCKWHLHYLELHCHLVMQGLEVCSSFCLHRSASSWHTCLTTATTAWACTPLSIWPTSFIPGQTWNCKPFPQSSWLTSILSYSLSRRTLSGRWRLRKRSEKKLSWWFCFKFFVSVSCREKQLYFLVGCIKANWGFRMWLCSLLLVKWICIKMCN